MARYTTVGEAEAARSALAAAGIDAWLGDENIIAIDWLYSQAVGSVKVLVRSEDLEQAREIVSSAATMPPLSPPAPAPEPAPEPERPRCPECGSLDARPVRRFRILLLSTALFVGLGAVAGYVGLGVTAAVGAALALLLTPSHRCTACGHRWNPPAEVRVNEPPLPDPSDTIEEPCPRCGSFEVFRIDYRRLKAIPLLITASMLIVFPIWLMLPKRRCDTCGLAIR